MRTPLAAEALQSALATLPAWAEEHGQITRTFTFSTFMQAMDFVNDTAALAEKADHHPDIDIRYNRVRLSLVTHDAGGITHNDIALATRIDHLAAS